MNTVKFVCLLLCGVGAQRLPLPIVALDGENIGSFFAPLEPSSESLKAALLENQRLNFSLLDKTKVIQIASAFEKKPITRFSEIPFSVLSFFTFYNTASIQGVYANRGCYMTSFPVCGRGRTFTNVCYAALEKEHFVTYGDCPSSSNPQPQPKYNIESLIPSWIISAPLKRPSTESTLPKISSPMNLSSNLTTYLKNTDQLLSTSSSKPNLFNNNSDPSKMFLPSENSRISSNSIQIIPLNPLATSTSSNLTSPSKNTDLSTSQSTSKSLSSTPLITSSNPYSISLNNSSNFSSNRTSNDYSPINSQPLSLSSGINLAYSPNLNSNTYNPIFSTSINSSYQNNPMTTPSSNPAYLFESNPTTSNSIKSTNSSIPITSSYPLYSSPIPSTYPSTLNPNTIASSSTPSSIAVTPTISTLSTNPISSPQTDDKTLPLNVYQKGNTENSLSANPTLPPIPSKESNNNSNILTPIASQTKPIDSKTEPQNIQTKVSIINPNTILTLQPKETFTTTYDSNGSPTYSRVNSSVYTSVYSPTIVTYGPGNYGPQRNLVYEMRNMIPNSNQLNFQKQIKQVKDPQINVNEIQPNLLIDRLQTTNQSNEIPLSSKIIIESPPIISTNRVISNISNTLPSNQTKENTSALPVSFTNEDLKTETKMSIKNSDEVFRNEKIQEKKNEARLITNNFVSSLRKFYIK